MKIRPFPLFTPGKQYLLADIPNEEGFALYARHIDGRDYPATVRKDESGCHYLQTKLNTRFEIANITGWHIASAK